LFFKVQNQNWLLFDKFLSDFNDSGPILTRIVSRFWTYFRNQNPTIVTWTATILVCVIEFLCQTEQGGHTVLALFANFSAKVMFGIIILEN
jgi:hypothetical protein